MWSTSASGYILGYNHLREERFPDKLGGAFFVCIPWCQNDCNHAMKAVASWTICEKEGM